ncbi:MAG: hypothetical protein A2Y91_06490 [Chloroflexi bacterium RBG_13_54_8]|nr:MAG: hypothetical protein A2Y91_06490 [Chloroflexi bacterium RBG_13_54_8]
MELEETKAIPWRWRRWGWRRGLRNRGMIDISQDPKTGEFVLIAVKNIRRKRLVSYWPEIMWRGWGSKEEVLKESKRLLEEMLLV